MESGFKSGISSIGSMNMGAQGNTIKTEKKRQGGSGLKLDLRLIIVIAAVIVVVIAAIIIIVGAVEKGKVKDAVIERSTKDLADMDLEKYYPDEIAEAMEETAKAAGKDYFKAAAEEADIIGISQISLKKYEDYLTDVVMKLVENYDADLKKKEINISKAYLVTYIMEKDSKEKPTYCFVIKVNGRYGAYNAQ